jgi:predicted TIM-barrel fold metal-dependent hydrolase
VPDYGIIDMVVNPFTPYEVANDQVGVDDVFYEKVRVPPEKRVGVEWDDYIPLMDEAGIEASLVISVKAGDMRMQHSFAIQDERVAEYCAQYPGRFFGLCGIDPSRITESMRNLERAVTEYGFVGAHLYPHWFGWPPDDRRYYPFYWRCAELGVPIMMQIGHCLDYKRDRILESVGRPLALEHIAIDFPELAVIGIHLGWPWTEEMIAVAYKHSNVYMAADAYGPRHWPKEYVHFVNTWGRNKCMFGTDWPVVHPVRAVQECEQLDLREDSKRLFYRDNAVRLFKLEGRLKGTAEPAAASARAR